VEAQLLKAAKRRGIVNVLALVMVFVTIMAAVSLTTLEFTRHALTVKIASERASAKVQEKLEVHLWSAGEGAVNVANVGSSASTVIGVLTLNGDGSLRFTRLKMDVNPFSRGLVYLGAPINGTVGLVTSLGNVFWLRLARVRFAAEGVSGAENEVILVVDGEEYTVSQLPLVFLWEAGSTHAFEWRQTVQLSPNTRFAWLWAATEEASLLQSGYVAVPEEGENVTAHYGKQYRVTVDYVAWKGETSPPKGVYWRDEGSDFPITATPYFGYVFIHYIVHNEETGFEMGFGEPTMDIVVNAPHTLTAVFEEE
jgi:hypothetical protein